MTKRLIVVLVLGLALVLALPACSSRGSIQVASIDTLIQKVTERHDAYVRADPNLPAADKADFLRSSELLRTVVAEAKKSAGE